MLIVLNVLRCADAPACEHGGDEYIFLQSKSVSKNSVGGDFDDCTRFLGEDENKKRFTATFYYRDDSLNAAGDDKTAEKD